MAIQRRLVEAVEVTESRVHVIRLKGIFDASTVDEFEKVVSYLLARNFYEVVVDLGHVEFVSSAGWGAFTAELRRVRQNQGDVKLANMRPDVYDVFLLLELDSFIQSFETVDEALPAFSQHVVTPEPEPVRSSDERQAAVFAPSDDESFGGQSEFVDDEYADEGEYENPSAGWSSEADAMEQVEYTGDDHADEGEYESFSTESYDQSGAAEQAEYAGEDHAREIEYGTPSVDSVGGGAVEAQNDFAMADEDGGSGSDHLTPAAASGPEMWELILASGKAAVDPYMFKKSARTLPEVEKPQESLAFGATKTLSRQPSEEDSLSGAAGESSAPDTSWDAGNDFDEFADPGVEPDSGFARGEPFVDDSSRRETTSELRSAAKSDSPDRISKAAASDDPGKFSKSGTDVKNKSVKPAPSRNSEHAGKSHSAFPEKTGFEHAQVKPARDDEFDEFETQDICDPWILDEIDTFPEEYEMEGGAVDGEEPSSSASKLLSDDLELETPLSQFPEQALERDEATQEIAAAIEQQTPFETRLRDRAGDTDASLRDSLTADMDEEAQVEPVLASPAEARGMLLQDDLQRDFSPPSLTGENLVTPGGDSFDPPARSEKKRTARKKKRKSKAKHAKPDRSSEVEALIAPQVKSVAPFQAGAADSDDNWLALEDVEEAWSETAFAPSVESPAFLQANDSAENLFAPPALDENGELIARASEPSSPHGNDEASHKLPPDGIFPKIPASANLEEIVCAVVATHPDFGPAMICKFIEDRFEPPVFISRSTVYRLLREAGLNTREKRQEYADQLLDPSLLTEGI